MPTYTLETVEQSLLDNADYEETNSVAKARAFVTAAIRFQALAPDSESHQSSSMSIGKQWVEDEKHRARAFIKANETRNDGADNGVNFLSVNYDFR